MCCPLPILWEVQILPNADASGNAAGELVSEAEAEIYVLVTNQALAKFKLTLEIPSN